MHARGRRFEFGDRGIIAVPPDHLIGHGVHIYLMFGELSMPPSHSRGRIGYQEHPYVGIGRHHCRDIPSLSDDAGNGFGDQLLLPRDQISTNIEICRD